MPSPLVRTLVVCLGALAWSAAAVAQPRGSNPPAATPAATAVPVLRSADGRRQVVATRTTTPVRIDGALDDDVWRQIAPTGDFIQSEPHEGQPATEPTDVYVAFDADTLYIAARCHDSAPGRVVVSQLRKDFDNEEQDTFEVLLDTFGDRRNGFTFFTNAGGAKADAQVASEGKETNASWDAVWFVKTKTVDDGWTLEMAIPFKSLRFREGDDQTWGINFSRRIRHKNEVTYWSPVQRAYNTIGRVSEEGNLAGLPPLTPGRNLRFKPYALAESVRETGAAAFDPDAQVGLDVKYGVTPSLTLDVTLNPDFAQVEADEQQVNLTQFSLFFPEKREFFLENSGIFYVGDAQRSNRRNPSPTPDEDMLLFFSRRIGLTADGRQVPITGGGRLTGQVAGMTVGLMSIQTREFQGAPGNNYTMLRARRNLFANSDVGGFLISRQTAGTAGDHNRVFGADATLRVLGGWDWSSFIVRSVSPGRSGNQHAYRSTILRQGRLSQLRAGMMEIGDQFVSDLSYYRRVGIRKYLLETGYRPRPKVLERHGIRETHFHVNWDYQTDLANRLVAKKIHQGITVAFNDGAYMEPWQDRMHQQLTRPLRLSRNTPPLPRGDYSWVQYSWRFNTDSSRAISLQFLPS